MIHIDKEYGLSNFCCDSLENIYKRDFFDIYYPKKNITELALFDDGGHGGIYPIKFCPFCGRELQFEEELHIDTTESINFEL